MFFRSMTDVTVWIVIAVFFLLLFSMRKNPFYAAGAFVQEFFTSSKFALHFIALLGILFANKIELWVEKNMQYHADFTQSISKLEGSFIVSLQHFFLNDTLTFFSSFFYVVIFPSMMVVSIMLYTYQRNYKFFYAVCYAIMLNYVVAIPFYLFFSVSEVWSFHPNVQFLIPQVFPSFEMDYRPLSGLHNCFPSLHTSISVSMAAIAFYSKNKFWKYFTLLSATFIIFSIFYLGIHWVTDMFGGLVLGFIAAKVGLLISEGRGWATSISASSTNDYLKGRSYYK